MPLIRMPLLRLSSVYAVQTSIALYCFMLLTISCHDTSVQTRRKRVNKQAPLPISQNSIEANERSDKQEQVLLNSSDIDTTKNKISQTNTQNQTAVQNDDLVEQENTVVSPGMTPEETNGENDGGSDTDTSVPPAINVDLTGEWSTGRDRTLIPVNKIPFEKKSVNLSTRTREIVCRVWMEYRAPKFYTAPNSPSSENRCVASPVSNGQILDAVNVTNTFRWLIGVAPVGYNAALDEDAHACAIMMNSAGKLSHSPSSDWSCYTSKGAGAAGASNLSLGRRDTGAVIKGYIEDRNVASLGHRIWIFARHLKNISIGHVGSANCTNVVGNTDSQQPSEVMVAYPAPGFFPKEALYGRWSMSLQGISLSMSEAVYSGPPLSRTLVTPAKALSNYKITNLSSNAATEGELIRHTEYGSRAMIIEFSPEKDGVTIEGGVDYQIEIRDLKIGSNLNLGSDYTISPGSADGLKNISYRVKLIDC